MSKAEISKALLATAEAMGTELSDGAIEIMVSDLAEYPDDDVFEALKKCRREHGGRLTLASVISRISTGHPGPEEAWSNSLGGLDEETTVVLTDQMAKALSVAAGLDRIAGRMAFIETYKKQDFSKPPVWKISLGWDKAGREGPILEAVRLGRLPARTALKELPFSEEAQKLADEQLKPELLDTGR